MDISQGFDMAVLEKGALYYVYTVSFGSAQSMKNLDAISCALQLSFVHVHLEHNLACSVFVHHRRVLQAAIVKITYRPIWC